MKQSYGSFARVSAKQWKQAIEKDLKGADYNKKLVWKPVEGVEVQPFYCDTDGAALFPASAPGVFPFTRDGSRWKICEDIPPLPADKAAALAGEATEGGADRVLFRMPEPVSGAKLKKLLSSVDTAKTGVCFDPSEQKDGGLKQAAELIKSAGKGKLKDGFILCDPLGLEVWGEAGRARANAAVKKLAQTVSLYKENAPGYRCIGAGGFHGEGADAVEEAAFALALGAEYLVLLKENGVSTKAAANAVVFHFSAGSLFFVEAAKLRAARAVWAHIVEKFDRRADARMRTHVSSSRLNKPVCDSEVNILRSTGEAMAAITGGCDSLSITAYDGGYNPGDSKSQAVARNTQLILRHECGFGHVSDPCGGSYYTDALTDKIARAAFELFLEIESKGGFLKCARSGFIKERLEKSAEERENRVAAGKEAIIGVNRYPIEGERIAARVKRAGARGAGKEFEKIRAATEKHAKKKGRFPSCFLVKTGDPAMSSARAVFSVNFFSAAGFEIIDGGFFTSAAKAATEAAKSRADVFAVCSEDSNYAVFAPAFARALKKKRKKSIIAVMGNPGEEGGSKCEKAGVEEVINIRSNILNTLKRILKNSGVKL